MKQNKYTKCLIIGAGGIGSYLAQAINELKEKEQLENVYFHIADNDAVESKNIMYQNFSRKDLGKNKAEALNSRFEEILPISKEIKTKTQLSMFQIIILAVDNYTTRNTVAECCHRNGKKFIDLRSFATTAMAYTSDLPLNDYKATLDLDDEENGSCQDKADIENGMIQQGNKIAAYIGSQLLLNITRNRPVKKHLVINL